MTEKALELLKAKRFVDLKNLFVVLNGPDVALILEEMPEESLPVLFRILPKELASEAFVEMDFDSQEVLIRAFTDKELKEVLDELFVDDAVDLIEEMPAGVVKRILRNTDNMGVGVWKNYGIEQAQGEYLAFVDADDYIESCFLEVLYENAVRGNCDIS
ncbi:MAG: glycosyltransferase, partial [Clostridia bacterium]|nr:glycosyltransferase [Clostridia bacterium]